MKMAFFKYRIDPMKKFFKMCHVSKTRMVDREKGTIKWFNGDKGYGFSSQEEGSDVFVHYSSIDGDGYRSLEEGQEVEFTVTDGQKGLQAESVIPLIIRL